VAGTKSLGDSSLQLTLDLGTSSLALEALLHSAGLAKIVRAPPRLDSRSARNCSLQDAARPVPVASVSISRDTATLVPTATLQLIATPNDASGNGLSRPVTWATSNPVRATVSTAGLVRTATT